MRTAAQLRRLQALQLALRAAAAAGISVAIAQALGAPGPIYAMIAAVIVTDLDPARTRSLAAPRLLGTSIGGALGAAMASAGLDGVWWMTVGVALGMAFCEIAVSKDAARLAGYVCAIVLLDHREEPWLYSLWRLAETFLGIVVAFAVSLMPKLVRMEPAPPAGR